MNTETQQSPWVADLRPPKYLWYLLLALPIVAAMAFAISQPITVLPRITLAPGYSFIDQDGKRFTSEDVRGSLVLYTFIDSRCTSPCVPTSATLASLLPHLAEVEMSDVPLQFVAIAVDPEHASPTTMRAHAKRLSADASQWHFVTGDAKQLKHVIGEGFGTYYQQDEKGNFTVDPVFVLVDGWGIQRAVYRTATPDVETIQRDLLLVVQEARNSAGVNRYAYEAAHLFLCYPK